MTFNTIFSKRNLKIIGYIITIIFSLRLCYEVYDYIKILNTFGNLVDYIEKFKEWVYVRLYFWSLLVLFGVGLIRSNFLVWVIPQGILFIGFFFFLLLVLNMEIVTSINLFIVILSLYLIVSFIVFRFFLKEKVRNFLKVKKRLIPYYYGLVVFIAAAYWAIFALIKEKI